MSNLLRSLSTTLIISSLCLLSLGTMAFATPPASDDLEFLPIVLQATYIADYSPSTGNEDFAPLKADVIKAAQQDNAFGTEGADTSSTNPGAEQSPQTEPQSPEKDNTSNNAGGNGNGVTAGVGNAGGNGAAVGQDNSNAGPDNNNAGGNDNGKAQGADVAAAAQERNDLKKEEKDTGNGNSNNSQDNSSNNGNASDKNKNK